MLDYPLADVIDLMREHLDHNRRKQPPAGVQRPQQPIDNKERVIYRKADDSWF